jgi:hypothetical protein
MPFHIGGGHGRGGIRVFVNDTDDQHFWKGSWWDWVLMGTGRSEFITVQVERFPFTGLESI